jgi:RHS repeat-associated protein
MQVVPGNGNSASSITIGGATNYFFYDYQGQRVKKIANGTPTVYIGKLYECTIGTCTKYIFGGITRIDLKPPAEPKDLLAFGGVVSERGNQEAPFGAMGTNFIADVYAKQTIENEQRVALKSPTTICGSNILYYHTDHLGSSNVITNSSGGNVEGVYYYPFGATRQQTGGDCGNHKFTGQEEDSETGLYYYGARYYDPALGRFISADSIVPDYTNPQAFNRYSYVLNNPLYYTDPTGQRTYSVGISLNLDWLGLSSQFSAGIAIDDKGTIASYSSVGFGVGATGGARASGGLNVSVSTAETVKDLSGPFNNVDVGYATGINASASYFTGESQNGWVTGSGITIGAGYGVGVSNTVTWTSITELGSLWNSSGATNNQNTSVQGYDYSEDYDASKGDYGWGGSEQNF